MTSLTTIKVASATRDRLKQGARSQGLSLGAYLDRLAADAERRERWDALRDAIAATTTEDMAAYAAETAEWERAELSDAAHAE
ncbi:MAG: hypothetical protein WA880_11455 [Ornithinimicrobium sp.]